MNGIQHMDTSFQYKLEGWQLFFSLWLVFVFVIYHPKNYPPPPQKKMVFPLQICV